MQEEISQSNLEISSQKSLKNPPNQPSLRFWIVFVCQIFHLLVVALSIVSLYQIHGHSHRSKVWEIIISTFYVLGYICLTVTIFRNKQLQNLRYTAPVTAITVIPIACRLKCDLYRVVLVTKGLCSTIPTFALAVYGSTKTLNKGKQSKIFLILLLLISIPVVVAMCCMLMCYLTQKEQRNRDDQ